MSSTQPPKTPYDDEIAKLEGVFEAGYPGSQEKRGDALMHLNVLRWMREGYLRAKAEAHDLAGVGTLSPRVATEQQQRLGE